MGVLGGILRSRFPRPILTPGFTGAGGPSWEARARLMRALGRSPIESVLAAKAGAMLGPPEPTWQEREEAAAKRERERREHATAERKEQEQHKAEEREAERKREQEKMEAAIRALGFGGGETPEAQPAPAPLEPTPAPRMPKPWSISGSVEGGPTVATQGQPGVGETQRYVADLRRWFESRGTGTPTAAPTPAAEPRRAGQLGGVGGEPDYANLIRTGAMTPYQAYAEKRRREDARDRGQTQLASKLGSMVTGAGEAVQGVGSRLMQALQGFGQQAQRGVFEMGMRKAAEAKRRAAAEEETAAREKAWLVTGAQPGVASAMAGQGKMAPAPGQAPGFTPEEAVQRLSDPTMGDFEKREVRRRLSEKQMTGTLNPTEQAAFDYLERYFAPREAPQRGLLDRILGRGE